MKNNDRIQAETISAAFTCLWLLVLVAVSLFIRVDDAAHYHYNPDESIHVEIAQSKTLSDVWHYARYETHPPLGHFLRYYWMKISDAEWFVRGQSLLFGILLIVLYYHICKRIGGRMAGMCGAAIVAFSHGIIILSCVARNYAFFLFFLSLAFYCYQRWRERRTHLALSGYGLFSAMAAATHFSGIFSIVCLTGFEAHSLFRKNGFRHPLRHWLAVNALVITYAAFLIHLWHPVLAPLQRFADPSHIYSLPMLALNALFYPLHLCHYLLPGNLSFVILCILLGLVVLSNGQSLRNDTRLRPFIFLLGLALMLGMLLFACGIYSFAGSRHSVWIFPMLILAIAYMLSIFCRWCSDWLEQKGVKAAPQVVACLLMLAGWLAYSPSDRFADSEEYTLTQPQWRELHKYMTKLGPQDAVIALRYHSHLLGNPLPFMGNTTIASMPFKSTHIFFDPFYPRQYYETALPDTARDALQAGMLHSVQTLHFLNLDLSHCPTLHKQVTVFHAQQSKMPSVALPITSVSVEAFINDLMDPHGQAHSCYEVMEHAEQAKRPRLSPIRRIGNLLFFNDRFPRADDAITK